MSTLMITDLSEISLAAKKLLASFEEEKVIAFYGEMGVGKTTLIKAICKELGVKDTVTSPTYSIVNEYKSLKGEKIYHFDFYRINSTDEAYDLGYEEYFYSKCFCFIEWPEKIAELLPLVYEKITIVLEDQKRIISY
ncbi:MAG: tRNA (adenosine(37)-N6)-threonylcarbamoyltransferase complex ATPase subunit type 1 TsaE [Bacteroidia bacterium]